MHPAPSVIAFTALSGLGFGQLFWLALGWPPVGGWLAFFLYAMAYALAVGGLLASVFHLANPKNAIKAFREWRSSWLSREGILAIAALLSLAPKALAQIFVGGAPDVLGYPGALLCLATVYSTGMIYTQLKTVPRWNQPLTPGLFVGYALGGGALLGGAIVHAGAILLLTGIAQIAAWRIGDRRFAEAGSTAETATGLGDIGRVKQFEPPHEGGNYLLHEMGYQVGRKHSAKLRVIAFICAFLLPLPIAFFGLYFSGALFIAAGVHLVGVLAIRWLFFAEARHVVSLYYA